MKHTFKLVHMIFLISLCMVTLGILGLTSCTKTPPSDTDTPPSTVAPTTPDSMDAETAAWTDKETDSETEGETQFSVPETPWLTEDGKLVYSVILPEGAGPVAQGAADELAEAFARMLGWTKEAVVITTDRAVPVEEGSLEILIGDTDRPESREHMATVGTDGYTVAVAGSKIVLAGYNEAAAAKAVDYYIQTVMGFGASETPTELALPSKDEVLFTYAQSEEEKAAYVAALNQPHIASTRYNTTDVVVVDLELTPDNPLYPVDNTGKTDCTASINAALAAMVAQGGGTVYLPAGQYLITDTITVPEFCSLRGDWKDPDYVSDGVSYGTVILARPAVAADETAAASKALFLIGGSGGVRGLTVYYPDQDINAVKAYPFTFYANGYMLPTVMECTVLNGYQGIGASTVTAAHEMFTVDTLKGTFLRTAAEVYNQADVGTWKTVTVHNRYWADCRLGDVPALEELNTYTKAHTVGLILGDLEWTEFAQLRITDCKYGIQIVAGKRIEFAGSLFDVEIRGCDIGMKIDSLDTRWGTVVANSIIEGGVCAIQNNTEGIVKLANVTLQGDLVGNNACDDSAALSGRTLDYAATYPKPAARLFVVTADPTGAEDATSAIQVQIDAAASAGGGVVYLPAGFYLCRGQLNLPAGVELRGSASVPTRDQWGSSRGTVLLVQYGVGGDYNESSPAFITLSERSGLNGIRLFYHTNSPLLIKEKKSINTAYAVRGTGADVYMVNCAIVAAGNGVDFSGCDRHYIKKLIACCYYNTMRVGGNDGIIEGCLQNATAICRVGSTLPLPNGWISEGDIFTKIFDPITRRSTQYIVIEEGSNEVVYNTFAYGVNTLVVCNGGENVFLCNLGSDNLGTAGVTRGFQVLMNDGSLTGVNLLRWNGRSYYHVGGKLSLYNRLTIEKKDETSVVDEEK